jgi:hypothetical protein
VSRAPEIGFACPHCGRETTCGVDGRGTCLACGQATSLDVSGIAGAPPRVERCPACAGQQLYVQRDFNQKAGITIVVIGSVLAPFTPFYSSLFAAALLDAVLYLLVPEITVCYRCHAHFRGFARNPAHQKFDLHLAEQYDVRKP